MSDQPGRSKRRRRRRGLTHRQLAQPFFLSPTWNWPEFDPACCQECGRVIPMHETGWIHHDTVNCEECYAILIEREDQREALLRSQSHLPVIEATPAPASAPATATATALPTDSVAQMLMITSPILMGRSAPRVQPQEPVVEPAIAAPPAEAVELKSLNDDPVQAEAEAVEIDGVTTAGFLLTEPTDAAWRSSFASDLMPTDAGNAADDRITDDDEIATTHAEQALPLIDAMIPRFELTAPTHEVWRLHFADELLAHEHASDPASTEDAGLSDALPLIDTMIPRFELTPPVEGAWREHFADASHMAEERCDGDNISAMNDTNAEALPLLDAVCPRFELSAPETAVWRRQFADDLLVGASDVDAAEQSQTDEDALPLIDAMIPRFELTPPGDGTWREHFTDLRLTSREAETPASTDTTTTDAAATLFAWAQQQAERLKQERETAAQREREQARHAQQNRPEPKPIHQDPTTPKPSKPPKPQAKARRRTPPETHDVEPDAPPRPLSFQHPVDALLEELHHRRIDEQFMQMIRRDRRRDPFFAEVDALLAAAVTLRDHWMSNRESQGWHRSSTG